MYHRKHCIGKFGLIIRFGMICLREYAFMINQKQTSQVNYYRIAMNHGQLQKYLSRLSAVKKSAFTLGSIRATCILDQCIQCFTVEIILRSYSSIAILRIYAPVMRSWKSQLISMMKNQRESEFISLLGEFLSLNATENEMLRKPGNFNEPRIHFCAQSRIHRLPDTAK